MKNPILFCLALVSTGAFAQQRITGSRDTVTSTFTAWKYDANDSLIRINPVLTGDTLLLCDYLSTRFYYPDICSEMAYSGTSWYTVSFNADGTVIAINAARESCPYSVTDQLRSLITPTRLKPEKREYFILLKLTVEIRFGPVIEKPVQHTRTIYRN